MPTQPNRQEAKPRLFHEHTGNSYPHSQYYTIDPRIYAMLESNATIPVKRPDDAATPEESGSFLSGDYNPQDRSYYHGFDAKDPESWKVPDGWSFGWNMVNNPNYKGINPETFRQHYPTFMQDELKRAEEQGKWSNAGWMPYIVAPNGEKYYLQYQEGSDDYTWKRADPYEEGTWAMADGKLIYNPGDMNPGGTVPVAIDKDGDGKPDTTVNYNKGTYSSVDVSIIDQGLTPEQLRDAWDKGMVSIKTDTSRGVVYAEVSDTWYNANGMKADRIDPYTLESTKEMQDYVFKNNYLYNQNFNRRDYENTINTRNAKASLHEEKKQEITDPGGYWLDKDGDGKPDTYFSPKEQKDHQTKYGVSPAASYGGRGAMNNDDGGPDNSGGNTGGNTGDTNSSGDDGRGGSSGGGTGDGMGTDGIGVTEGLGGGGPGGRGGPEGTSPVYYDSGAGETLIDPVVGSGTQDMDIDYNPEIGCPNDISEYVDMYMASVAGLSNIESESGGEITDPDKEKEKESGNKELTDLIKQRLSDSFTIKDIIFNEDGTLTVLLGNPEHSYIENAQLLNMAKRIKLTPALEIYNAGFPAKKTGAKKFKGIAITPGVYKNNYGDWVPVDEKMLRANDRIFTNKPIILVDFDKATPENTHEGQPVGVVLASYFCDDYQGVVYEGELYNDVDIDLSSIAGSSVGLALSQPLVGKHIALIPRCSDGKVCLGPQDPNARLLNMAGEIKMDETREAFKIIQQEKRPLVAEIVNAELQIKKLKPEYMEDRMRELYGLKKATLELLAAEVRPDQPQSKPTPELNAARKNLTGEDLLEDLISRDSFWRGK